MVDSSPSRERLTRVVELLRGAEDEHESSGRPRAARRVATAQRSRGMLPQVRHPEAGTGPSHGSQADLP
jgi:hypothetical protein